MSKPTYHIGFLQPGVAWKSVPSIERQGLQVTRALRSRGHQITWLPILVSKPGCEDDISLIRLARREGFEVVPIYLPEKFNLWKSARRLRQHLSGLHLDILSVTGYKAGILTAFVRDYPTIEVLRGWTGQTAQVRLYEFLDKLLLRRHDLIVAVSPLQREVALKFSVPSERVVWIPNALDLDALPARMDGSEWKRHLHLAGDAVLVGGVGRLSSEKGYHHLIEAFSSVLQAQPRARLLLAGDGIERERLRRLTHVRRLENHVLFLGEIPNGAQLISGLSVLVNPSLSEGMPNVILEAFAYRTPVVATAVGGVPELVKHGETGWLVPPKDPNALAQAVVEALSNPEEARRRAENAYEHLLAHFTVDKQVNRWEEVLKAAVENWKGKRGNDL